MANFEPAYWKVVKDEGLWSDDAEDSGGETVLGITRVHDADWEGWKLVDAQKKLPDYPENLKNVVDKLHALALPYYKRKYWDVIWGDKINDQEQAYRIVDMQINAGSAGIKLAQRALGITETGKMNQETLDNLNNE